MATPPKKLINNPENVVEEMIQGIVACHPSLVRIEGYHVLLRSDYLSRKSTKVAIISGGGSGHEPAHAGFIGQGMLTAAVCGGVFASPSVDSILAAIRSVSCPEGPGCLLIVKNYTGDRLNFGLAAETAKSEGIKCAMVIVGDDVAVNAGDEDDGTITGRRGLAGTIFVHKCAGAMAEREGATLSEVTNAGKKAASEVGSMGVALTTCTVPGGVPSERIGQNEMELGLGIHNEPGREKKKMEDVDSVVNTLIQEIVAVMNKTTSLGQEQPPSAPSSSGSGGGGGGGGGVTGRVAVMINNLGGTPMLELYVAARSIHTSLESLGFIVARSYVGSFMTSLEMQGMMITVCVVDDARLSLLDAETRAPAWPRTESNLRATGRVGGTSGRTVSAPPSTSSLVLGGGENGGAAMSEEGRKMKECFKHACVCLIEAETELTEMDRIVGDGDCGQTFKRGALAIMEDLHQYPDPTTNPSGYCTAIGDSIRRSMGGSSGAILDIMFRAASTNFQSWRAALKAGVTSASFYGGAKVGYRTMLDALIPASNAANATDVRTSWINIVEAAESGAEGTKTMKPLAGRSSYIKQAMTDGTADPGAKAMAIVMRAYLDKYQETSKM